MMVIHEYSHVLKSHQKNQWYQMEGGFKVPFSSIIQKGIYEIKFDTEIKDFTFKYFLN